MFTSAFISTFTCNVLGIFASSVQALVFATLSAAYIAESVE